MDILFMASAVEGVRKLLSTILTNVVVVVVGFNLGYVVAIEAYAFCGSFICAGLLLL